MVPLVWTLKLDSGHIITLLSAYGYISWFFDLWHLALDLWQVLHPADDEGEEGPITFEDDGKYEFYTDCGRFSSEKKNFSFQVELGKNMIFH